MLIVIHVFLSTPLKNNSTAASTVVLGAAIPEALSPPSIFPHWCLCLQQVARGPDLHLIRGVGWLVGAGGGFVLCSLPFDSSQLPRTVHSFLFFIEKSLVFSTTWGELYEKVQVLQVSSKSRSFFVKNMFSSKMGLNVSKKYKFCRYPVKIGQFLCKKSLFLCKMG